MDIIVSFDRGYKWIDLTPTLPFPVKVFKDIVAAGSTVYVATTQVSLHQMMGEIGVLSPMQQEDTSLWTNWLLMAQRFMASPKKRVSIAWEVTVALGNRLSQRYRKAQL